MTDKNTGGPAFPVTLQPGEMYKSHAEFDGMTLRDYFAAKAMQAMITTAAGPCMDGLDGFEFHTASAAYRIADAMLEARQS